MLLLFAQHHYPAESPISGTFKGKQNENGNFEYQVKIAVEQIKGKWPLVWVTSREGRGGGWLIQGCATWQGLAFGLFALSRVHTFFCLWLIQGCATWQGLAFGLFALSRVHTFFCLWLIQGCAAWQGKAFGLFVLNRLYLNRLYFVSFVLYKDLKWRVLS